MNNIREIRKLLGLTQAELAKKLGKSQSNITCYETRDQMVPPEVARKLISVARSRGLIIDFNTVYGALVKRKANGQGQAEAEA